MKWIVAVLIPVCLAVSGCAGAPGASPAQAGSSGPARSSSDRALAGMDSAFSGSSASPGRASPAEVSAGAMQLVQSEGRKPSWVDDPYAGFPRSEYFAAVGSGGDRFSAERNALVALTGLFGQNIQAELRSLSFYTETVSQGRVQFAESAALEEAISTTTQLDTLVGAEIRGVWDSGRSGVFAVAVMEKAQSRGLYAGMIRANNRLLDALISIPAQQRNSLDGYARWRFAALVADANVIYGRVLTMLGGDPGIDTSALRGGNEYRLEMNAIPGNIPVTIRVSQDRSNRIQGAFTDAVSRAGFRTTGRGGRYLLDVTVSLDPIEYPNNANKFCRGIVNANLIDTRDNQVIYPFTLTTDREGHVTLAEAENRVIRTIVERVAGTYAQGLSDFLSVLLPR